MELTIGNPMGAGVFRHFQLTGPLFGLGRDLATLWAFCHIPDALPSTHFNQ
jgi:hypothetical protein